MLRFKIEARAPIQDRGTVALFGQPLCLRVSRLLDQRKITAPNVVNLYSFVDRVPTVARGIRLFFFSG